MTSPFGREAAILRQSIDCVACLALDGPPTLMGCRGSKVRILSHLRGLPQPFRQLGRPMQARIRGGGGGVGLAVGLTLPHRSPVQGSAHAMRARRGARAPAATLSAALRRGLPVVQVIRPVSSSGGRHVVPNRSRRYCRSRYRSRFYPAFLHSDSVAHRGLSAGLTRRAGRAALDMHGRSLQRFAAFARDAGLPGCQELST